MLMGGGNLLFAKCSVCKWFQKSLSMLRFEFRRWKYGCVTGLVDCVIETEFVDELGL